jgi:hypothetical protein
MWFIPSATGRFDSIPAVRTLRGPPRAGQMLDGPTAPELMEGFGRGGAVCLWWRRNRSRLAMRLMRLASETLCTSAYQMPRSLINSHRARVCNLRYSRGTRTHSSHCVGKA